MSRFSGLPAPHAHAASIGSVKSLTTSAVRVGFACCALLAIASPAMAARVTAPMSLKPMTGLSVPADGAAATVEVSGGETLTVPNSVGAEIREQRLQHGLPSLSAPPTATAAGTHRTSARAARSAGVRARTAASIGGCASAWMSLGGEYNKGLWVYTGYEWEDYAYIPDWIEWKLTGSNETFDRPISNFWDEGVLEDYDWEGEHFADKGGGSYYAEIEADSSKVYTDEGVCYLTSPLTGSYYVGY